MATATETEGVFGEVLRYWRGVRGKSQLDLASAAMTTPRYVSFVETGRAQPSRQMVVRLAPRSRSRSVSATGCSSRRAMHRSMGARR